MEQHQFKQQPSFFEKNNTLLKGILIAFLVLVMLIPTAFIRALISERKQRQQEVIGEISDKWAKEQTIIGPIIVVPAYKYSTNSENKVTRMQHKLHFLPEQLSINGVIKPEVRHRSLYDVSVYRSELRLEGTINTQALAPLLNTVDSIDWANAYFVTGITDSRGLDDNPMLQLNGTEQKMDVSAYSAAYLKETISAPIALSPTSKSSFAVTLKIKGTGKLYFTPCGNTTTVNIKSSKGTPSYDGKYMPDRIQPKADSGFSASWKVLHVSRGYPQYWTGDINQGFEESSFGVRLIQQGDHYTKTERSVKYAILILSLTFLVFFFIEIIQKKRVHPLQYVLVGIALCVFYTLLLSISEYTGFNIAYIIAALATIILIGRYIYYTFKSMKVAGIFSAALTSLYAYIFFLIQLKDYSLLFGSIGLFVILAIIMHYSRNINWYNIQKENSQE